MKEDETIFLLQECDAGAKMAVDGIRQVLDEVHSPEMKHLLSDALARHEQLDSACQSMLDDFGEPGKDPKVMAQIMSDLTIWAKRLNDSSDEKIAELMVDGCHMGIKSLHRYMNQYPLASTESKAQAAALNGLEREMQEGLYPYL